MKNKWIFTSLTAVFVFLILPVEKIQAIPAFARKYKFSCNTCHVAVPKLKAYGEEFAANGFMLPDAPEPVRAHVKTGDETLLLMKDFPLAVRFDAYLQAADRDIAKTDFQVPYGLKLLSGGPISKHVSYYFYFYIDERGEVAGLEDAYIHFNNIGGSTFDLMIGQFQVSDPLFKRELRLTFEDYQIYKIHPGNSKANLTYDRGIIATYGFDFGLDVVAMAVNGNGINPSINRLFDSDNSKNFAFRATQSTGVARIGAFVYSGNESNGVNENNISIYGPDITIGNENIELNAQYLHREDDNPTFIGSGATTSKLDGGFVELIYMPDADQSKFLFTLLYNKVDGDLFEYETGTFSVSHMAARNLRILGEVTYDVLAEKTKFTIGVMSAF